jgi:hypothetical protein
VHTVFGAIEKNDRESFKTLDNISQDDIIKSIEILNLKD